MRYDVANMFLTILHREIHHNLTSRSLLLILAVLSVIVVLSSYTQAHYYQKALADYATRQSMYQAESNSEATVLIRPVPPLLPLFNGIYDNLPDEAYLRSDSFFLTTASEDLQPESWFFPDTDIALIIGVVLTLLAVLIGHDAIAAEKDDGTFGLLLAAPAPRNLVLSAKLTGAVLAITLVLVFSVILYLATLVLATRGTYRFSGARIAEILVLTAVGVLTTGFFAILGIAISITVKRSSVGLSASLVVWIVLVIIWPSIGPHLAALMYKVPPTQASRRSMLANEAQLDAAELAEHNRAARELSTQRSSASTAYGKYLDIRRAWIERKKIELGGMVEKRRQQLHRQQSIGKYLVSISPYAAFDEILADLCGTGFAEYEAFMMAAERYGSEEFLKASLEFRAAEKPWLTASPASTPFNVPVFNPPELSLGQRLKNVATLIGILVLEILSLTTLSFWMFQGFTVRRIRC